MVIVNNALCCGYVYIVVNDYRWCCRTGVHQVVCQQSIQCIGEALDVYVIVYYILYRFVFYFYYATNVNALYHVAGPYETFDPGELGGVDHLMLAEGKLQGLLK